MFVNKYSAFFFIFILNYVDRLTTVHWIKMNVWRFQTSTECLKMLQGYADMKKLMKIIRRISWQKVCKNLGGKIKTLFPAMPLWGPTKWRENVVLFLFFVLSSLTIYLCSFNLTLIQLCTFLDTSFFSNASAMVWKSDPLLENGSFQEKM